MATNTVEERVLSNDAEEYVDSIIGSKRITRVDTPLSNGRKRNACEPCHIESTIKTLRVTAMAKRVLL